MQVYEVFDSVAGSSYYTVAKDESAAVQSVFNFIGPVERRRLLDLREKITREMKELGIGDEFPENLTDEDYLMELEVTDSFDIVDGLVIRPIC